MVEAKKRCQKMGVFFGSSLLEWILPANFQSLRIDDRNLLRAVH